VAVLGHDFKLVGGGAFPGKFLLQRTASDAQILGRDHLGKVHRRCFRALVPGELLAGSVGGGEVSGNVDSENRIIGIFEQLDVTLFTGLQGSIDFLQVAVRGLGANDALDQETARRPSRGTERKYRLPGSRHRLVMNALQCRVAPCPAGVSNPLN